MLKKLSLIISVVIILISPMVAYSQNILKGFKILNVARKNIPLGAQWIDNVGPDGSGVSKENIRFSEGVDYFSIEDNLKADISISILNFLGLTGDLAKKVQIQCKNLKIYTVNDISKTKIRTGQYMLYEYISGDSVSVVYDKSAKAAIELQLKKAVKDIKINPSASKSQKAAFSGTNIAFGYRVFKFGSTKVKEKKVRIKDTKDGGGIREVKVFNYNFSFNDYNLKTCLGNVVPIDENKLKTCGNTNPVDVFVRNYNNTDISGAPLSSELKISPDSFKDFRYSYKTDNKLVTDNIRITYAYIPRAMFLYMTDYSIVEVRTAITPLTMLSNPIAAGW